MKHPSETDLALFAGEELGALSRWRVLRHTRACPECRHIVAGFRRDRLALRELATDLPAGLAWGHLAAEMRANIHVGLEAGECVAPAGFHLRTSPWRPALAASFAAVVIAMGWWLNLPQPRTPGAGGMVLEATASGIELKQNDRALTLLSPRSEDVTLSVNTQGVLGARYVDADTGHVTINNVYAQ